MTKEQGTPLREEIIHPKEELLPTSWIIEEGIIDPDLPFPEDVTTLKQYAKVLDRVKKRSRFPVPKHCEINHRPANFDKYIMDLLPSIKVVISNHAFIPMTDPDIDGIVNNLIVYLYDKDSDGLPRWQRYDEKREPRPPYHKWVLRYAWFAAKTYLAKKTRYARDMGIQTSERPDGDFAAEPGYIHHSLLNKLCPELEGDSTDYRLMTSEFIRHVDKLRQHLKELETVYSKINPLSWQVYALSIVDKFMAGEPLADIRLTIGATGISRTSMNKWWDSIRKEIREWVDENPFEQ